MTTEQISVKSMPPGARFACDASHPRGEVLPKADIYFRLAFYQVSLCSACAAELCRQLNVSLSEAA